MNTIDTYEYLNNIYEIYGRFDIVIVSLSLANEGFNDLTYRSYTNTEVSVFVNNIYQVSVK